MKYHIEIGVRVIIIITVDSYYIFYYIIFIFIRLLNDFIYTVTVYILLKHTLPQENRNLLKSPRIMHL